MTSWEKLVAALTWQEWAAALTGLVCVWLTVKNRLSNWLWGIVSVLFYAWVFWKSEIYANFGLNLFFFLPCCIYGWWYWAKCGPNHNDDLPVRRLTPRVNLVWIGITLAISAAIGFLMAHYTKDPIPYADGLATGMSIVAQWMQAKKWFENWWYWIAVDFLYIGYIFPSQHFYISMALYIVFLIVCIRGLMEWKPLIVSEAETVVA